MSSEFFVFTFPKEGLRPPEISDYLYTYIPADLVDISFFRDPDTGFLNGMAACVFSPAVPVDFVRNILHHKKFRKREVFFRSFTKNRDFLCFLEQYARNTVKQWMLLPRDENFIYVFDFNGTLEDLYDHIRGKCEVRALRPVEFPLCSCYRVLLPSKEEIKKFTSIFSFLGLHFAPFYKSSMVPQFQFPYCRDTDSFVSSMSKLKGLKSILKFERGDIYIEFEDAESAKLPFLWVKAMVSNSVRYTRHVPTITSSLTRLYQAQK